MDEPWLKSYPPGIPSAINPDRYQSILDIFEESSKDYAESPALHNLGVTLTYREVHTLSLHFAAYLQQTLKLKKGDRFAIMLPNILQYPVVLYGALRAGLTIVNVNPLYTSRELSHQLSNAGATAIVVLANFAHTLQVILPETSVKHVIVANIGDFFSRPKALLTHVFLKYIKKKIPDWQIPHAISFRETLKKGEHQIFDHIDISPQDIAFLQYTGGTTGVAKGAMLTHRNIIANILQAEAWFNPLLEKHKEIIITALPLYHIFSLLANCLYMMRIGALSILITNPRDVPQMVKDIAKFKFTILTGVNTLFQALLDNAEFNTLSFSQLKLSLGGGAPVRRVVADRWETLTKTPLLEAYGLTEASPCVAINPFNMKHYNSSIGLPVSSTFVRILNDELEDVSLDEAGELAVKGPQVMTGYWNNPEETKKVFTPDGWLLTGDIAAMNTEGFLRILERKKDLILVSGFNVYPNEIEEVLMSIPGVREAAVVGVPDEHSGETIKAFVVKKNPDLTQEDILKFCHENLTAYKVPRFIEFRDSLPKTNVGKILRRGLKET